MKLYLVYEPGDKPGEINDVIEIFEDLEEAKLESLDRVDDVGTVYVSEVIIIGNPIVMVTDGHD